MAQVTSSLVAEQRTRHLRGEHINLTINEEEQLLWAWEELQHMRRIEAIRQYGHRYECMDILISRGLGTYTGGFVDRFDLNEGKLRVLSREEVMHIYALISTKLPLQSPEQQASLEKMLAEANEASSG